jgi:hypothetical protein
VKCDFIDPRWLTYGSTCEAKADFILTGHLLGYPNGKVANLPPMRLCMTHLTLEMAQFVADPGKQPFGLTVMRLHEDDKIVLTPRIDREPKEIGQ